MMQMNRINELVIAIFLQFIVYFRNSLYRKSVYAMFKFENAVIFSEISICWMKSGPKFLFHFCNIRIKGFQRQDFRGFNRFNIWQILKQPENKLVLLIFTNCCGIKMYSYAGKLCLNKLLCENIQNTDTNKNVSK